MPTFESSGDFAIRADGVSKKFLLGLRSTSLKDRLTGISDKSKEEFWAFEDVSVTIPRGSMLGIIGRNGSGKSTFLRTLCGVYRPTKGQVEVRGRITALLELGAGFHEELTGRENIYMNGAVVGLSRDYMDSVMADIIDMADIGTFIDAPIDTYSSGMRARLGFAVSVQMQPEILLADEITAVGDIAFKDNGIKRMNELRSDGATIVQVSHSLPMLLQNCDQVLWLHHGRVRRLGDPKEVIEEYKEFGAIDHSGRQIGKDQIVKPEQQPTPPPKAAKKPAKKPATVAVPQRGPAARKAAAAKRRHKAGVNEDWFEFVSFLAEDGAEPIAGAPCRLQLRINATEELIDPLVDVRFLSPKGIFTGLRFTSGHLGPGGLDQQIEASLPALGMTAGLYGLRIDIRSAGKIVATKYQGIKVRWLPAGAQPNSPLESTWNVDESSMGERTAALDLDAAL